MKRALVVMILVAGAAGAAVMGGGGTGAVVDVLAALVGKDVNATSYTATSTTGPGFISTGDRVDAVKLGTGARASIGTCNGGEICAGPNGGSGTGFRVHGYIVSQTAQITSELDLLGDNAYLRNNSGPVRLNDVDGFVVNGGTSLKGRYVVPVVFDSAAISNNACNPQSVTVPGVQADDFVEANARFALPSGVGIQGTRATAVDTVEVNFCNSTSGGELDPVSGTYFFKMER